MKRKTAIVDQALLSTAGAATAASVVHRRGDNASAFLSSRDELFLLIGTERNGVAGAYRAAGSRAARNAPENV